MDGIVQVEEPLFASVTSPFIFSEFDVNYHRQAVGQVRTNQRTLFVHVTTLLISDWPARPPRPRTIPRRPLLRRGAAPALWTHPRRVQREVTHLFIYLIIYLSNKLSIYYPSNYVSIY